MTAQKILIVASMLLFVFGCSESKSPSESPIQAHAENWVKVAGGGVHAERVAELGPDSCRSCHGEQLDGAGKAPSCGECHDGPSGHPYGWVALESDSFHGLSVAQKGPEPCQQCHGESYRGEGWSEVSCYQCHDGPSGHPTGWMIRSSLEFHGREVLLNGPSDCRRCHGNDLGGGTSGLACSACHG